MIIKDLCRQLLSSHKSPNGERYVVEDVSRLTYNIRNPDILSDWRMVFHEVADWIDANGKITLTVDDGHTISGERIVVVDAFCKTRQAAREFFKQWRYLPTLSRYFNNRPLHNPHRVWSDWSNFDAHNHFFPYKACGIRNEICDYLGFSGLFQYNEVREDIFDLRSDKTSSYALFQIETDAILGELPRP